MATTSKSKTAKSASRKTKTTRKASASTTRKTTAKKVTAKKKTTKPAASKAAKTTSKSASTNAKTSGAAKTAPVGSQAAQDLNSLRSLNLFVVFASVVQGALILWLSKAYGGIRSINVSYPTTDTLASANGSEQQIVNASHHLFDVHLSWVIAAFLFVTAIMHLGVATWMRRRYEREVSQNINRARWATYAVSGSLLLTAIALTAGISDLVTLLAVIGFNVIACLVALSREHYTKNGERSRLVYGIGALAAAGPWVIFLINVLGTHQYGDGGTPKFVYWLYLTGLVLVLALGKNLRLQTRARGRWLDYHYAERVYIWLSLVGSAAVTWQIYASVLKK